MISQNVICSIPDTNSTSTVCSIEYTSSTVGYSNGFSFGSIMISFLLFLILILQFFSLIFGFITGSKIRQ